MLKQKGLYLIPLLFICAIAWANTPLTTHNSSNTNLFDRTSSKRFIVLDGSGMYIRNDANMLVSSTLQPPIQPAQPTQGDVFQPNLGWGYDLLAEYYSGNTGLSFEWIGYDVTTQGEDTFGAVFANNFFSLQSKFKIINVSIPYQLRLLERIGMKFGVGIQYADLQESWRETLIANTPLTEGRETDAAKATGLGAYFGIDLQADVTSKFNALFGANIAVVKFKQTLRSGVSRIRGANNHTSTLHNLVPGMDIKLGGSYNLPVTDGNLSAKVLWDTRIYSSGFFAGGSMAWSGLICGLKWVGDI